MIRTQIYLQDQQYHLAKLTAEENDIAFSELIRHGLDLALEEAKKKKVEKPGLLSLAGKFSFGPGHENLWQEIDSIYDSF